MNTDLILVAVISAIGGIVGGTGGAEAIKSVTRRRPKTVVTVDNEVKLAQQAAAQAAQSASYAQQMEQSARAAWGAAHAAEERLGAVTRQAQGRIDEMDLALDQVEHRLAAVNRYLAWILGMIAEPGMHIDHLRESVSRHRPPVGVPE